MLEGTSRNARCSKCTRVQTDDTHKTYYTQSSVGTDTYKVYVFITAFSRSLQASIHLHTLPNSIAPHAPICAPCYCLRARAPRDLITAAASAAYTSSLSSWCGRAFTLRRAFSCPFLVHFLTFSCPSFLGLLRCHFSCPSCSSFFLAMPRRLLLV